jgi:hypothetical protein
LNSDDEKLRAIVWVRAFLFILSTLLTSAVFSYEEFRYLRHGVKIRVEVCERSLNSLTPPEDERPVGLFYYWYNDKDGGSHLRKFSFDMDRMKQATGGKRQGMVDVLYLDDEPGESALAIEVKPFRIYLFIGLLLIAGVVVIGVGIWSLKMRGKDSFSK